MTSAALAVSICFHVFFFVGVLGDRNSNRVFGEGQALRLAGIQLLGAIAILCGAFGQEGAGVEVARWLTFPAVAAHVWGFLLFRARGTAPRGTPGFRLFEDALYASHAALAAVALLLGAWSPLALLPR